MSPEMRELKETKTAMFAIADAFADAARDAVADLDAGNIVRARAGLQDVLARIGAIKRTNKS